MKTIDLPILALLLACGVAHAQADHTATKNQPSHTAAACTKDSQCPSGQRCGFSGGDCSQKGNCIVPSNDTHCIDPGGRCGCDGRPVEIICAVGSRTEFTSAPVNAVGPCPHPCTENTHCAPGLLCQKGFCSKPN